MQGDVHKVNAGHLKRNAYLYIRQSTPRQVLENTGAPDPALFAPAGIDHGGERNAKGLGDLAPAFAL